MRQTATSGSNPQNLISYGNITFNADGSLASIDPALTSATNISWNSPTSTSTLTFDLGTVGTRTGLRQLTDAYSSILDAKPLYDPSQNASSMSSGAIVPHFTKALTITDSNGTTRNLNLNFLRTDANEWSVEVTAQPTTDLVVATSAVPGQIAYGTIEFNSDGTFKNISPSLNAPIQLSWLGNTAPETIHLNLGPKDGTGGLAVSSASTATYSATGTQVIQYSPTVPTKNMTSGKVAPDFYREISVVDSSGKLRTLNLDWLKTGNNTWTMEIAAKNSADLAIPSSAPIAYGNITFNGDGTLRSVATSLTGPIAIAWAGAATSSFTLDLGTAGPIRGTPNTTVFGLSNGLSQSASDYKVTKATQNGTVAGEAAEISIDQNGYVIGNYVNGSVRKLFKIPLVDFVNSNALITHISNVYEKTGDAGKARYFGAGSTEKSAIQSHALENSNVDMSNEMSEMIMAQRSYQSNSKLISVTDDMLKTVKSMLD